MLTKNNLKNLYTCNDIDTHTDIHIYTQMTTHIKTQIHRDIYIYIHTHNLDLWLNVELYLIYAV